MIIDQAETDNLSRTKRSTVINDKIANYTKKFKINWYCKLPADTTAWQLAESWITFRQITDPDDSESLGCVLAALHKERIKHADTGSKGTQLKVAMTFSDSQRAVFKPMTYERDYLMVGTPYAGRDRHNADIAAFHLNRIIGLNRVPIVLGRKIDLESDIRPIAHRQLLSTYFYKDGNTCFYGKCLYCKGPEYGVCAVKTMLEGSVTLWLPDSYSLGSAQPHPWRRTYRPNKPAKWESDPDYCRKVKDTRPYENPPRLLDLIDIAIFDYIISNADRHHYETFEYSKDSIVIALDNGKAFGNPYTDEYSILAPLYQCCIVRRSMYNRLMDLRGEVLGQVLFNVLQTEPLHPILTPQNYIAVDRRLEMVIKTIDTCIKNHGTNSVLQDDGYP